ncbi:DEAD/DEAH box helicase [Bradymonas sediminis]|uniref:DEAD/DEAH box helicase n=1 Tax=Bradymonas sediminis TaxID=1548548 RepID=UPI001EF7DAF1|nr:DEAD/DEAH box helicase [Bradymonas sediminis]
MTGAPSTRYILENFQELDLIEPLQRAIAAENYESPSEIQAQAIPSILEGRDLLGCAQTGTGKTAAFSLPMLHILSESQNTKGRRVPRGLILSPTRELAAQICSSIETYGKFLSLRSTVIYGGVSERPQIRDLKKGVDIIVATPGRFLDLMSRGFIDLNAIEFFILDEADRMLDMGFINDIRKIINKLPKKRQNLLFSATLPSSIVQLANQMLRNPVTVEVAPETPTLDAIEQRLMFVTKADKANLMVHLLKAPDVSRSIIFTRTKHGANRLTERLEKAGFPATAIHGNKSQAARRRALNGFRKGSYDILVATDVASRGIDVDDVTHVFNYDLPDEAESYVHRIGRTGRAGRSGVAISFCDTSEGHKLRSIEKTIAQAIPPDEEHEFHSPAAMASRNDRKKSSKGGGRRGNNSRGRNSRNKSRGKSGGNSRGRNSSRRKSTTPAKKSGEGAKRRGGNRR